MNEYQELRKEFVDSTILCDVALVDKQNNLYIVFNEVREYAECRFTVGYKHTILVKENCSVTVVDGWSCIEPTEGYSLIIKPNGKIHAEPYLLLTLLQEREKLGVPTVKNEKLNRAVKAAEYGDLCEAGIISSLLRDEIISAKTAAELLTKLVKQAKENLSLTKAFMEVMN